MSDSASGVAARPNPARVRLTAAINSSSTLAAVARGVAAASEYPLLVYVERRGKRYRWSPAHRGGPYPLVRITARFLGIDHHNLVLPFRGLHDGTQAGFGADGLWEGVCIIGGSEDHVGPPDAWTLLEFTRPTTASAAKPGYARSWPLRRRAAEARREAPSNPCGPGRSPTARSR